MILPVRAGKGSVPQVLALSPTLLERLRVYYRGRQPKEWLFPSQQHPDHPLKDSSLRHLCRKAGRRAGIPHHVHPHRFRHACATHRLDAGVDLRTLQIFLGHADIRTTASYRHVSLQRLPAARSPFDTLPLQPIEYCKDDGRWR